MNVTHCKLKRGQKVMDHFRYQEHYPRKALVLGVEKRWNGFPSAVKIMYENGDTEIRHVQWLELCEPESKSKTKEKPN